MCSLFYCVITRDFNIALDKKIQLQLEESSGKVRQQGEKEPVDAGQAAAGASFSTTREWNVLLGALAHGGTYTCNDTGILFHDIISCGYHILGLQKLRSKWPLIFLATIGTR